MYIFIIIFYILFFFFFNDTATTEIYTLSLHDALPISDRPQLLESVLGAGEMVAVEDLGAVARQQGGSGAVPGVNDRSQALGRRVDQRRRQGWFGAVEFVINGTERGLDGLGLGLVGGVNGGLDAADDEAHQIHDRG